MHYIKNRMANIYPWVQGKGTNNISFKWYEKIITLLKYENLQHFFLHSILKLLFLLWLYWRPGSLYNFFWLNFISNPDHSTSYFQHIYQNYWITEKQLIYIPPIPTLIFNIHIKIINYWRTKTYLCSTHSTSDFQYIYIYILFLTNTLLVVINSWLILSPESKFLTTLSEARTWIWRPFQYTRSRELR